MRPATLRAVYLHQTVRVVAISDDIDVRAAREAKEKYLVAFDIVLRDKRIDVTDFRGWEERLKTDGLGER